MVKLPKATKRKASESSGTDCTGKITSNEYQNRRTQNTTTKQTQMFLDYGQKSFAKSILCPKCSMLYVKSDEADVKTHAKYCLRNAGGPVLSSVHGFKVLFQDEDGHHSRSGCIVEASPKERSHQSIIKMVLELVQSELGCDDKFIREDIEAHRKIYLYVRGKTVVGCLVAEDVSMAQTTRLRSSIERDHIRSILITTKASDETSLIATCSNKHSNKTKTESGVESSESIVDPQVVPAATTQSTGSSTIPFETTGHSVMLLGVRLIWVHCAERRNGIAKQLLDAARQHFVFGKSFAKDCIAYSQPTEDGFNFAATYSAACISKTLSTTTVGIERTVLAY